MNANEREFFDKMIREFFLEVSFMKAQNHGVQ